MEAKNQDRLDRWLDQALWEIGNAEPRAGLENRVLARVREQQERRWRWNRWWMLGFAAAAVAMLLMAFLIKKQSRVEVMGQRNAGATVVSSAGRQQGGKAQPISGSRETAMSKGRASRPGRARNLRRDASANPSSTPGQGDKGATKQEQFPSPAPLSEQEVLLARYVRNLGDKAVLMARAQTELRRRDEAEFAPATGEASQDPEQESLGQDFSQPD